MKIWRFPEVSKVTRILAIRILLIVNMWYAVPAFGAEDGRETALMGAASKEDIVELKSLLDKGADVNAKDKLGWTALFYAAAYSSRPVQIIEELLKRGAAVNAKDRSGQTALMIAVARRNTGIQEIVRILLGHAADLNVQDNNGRTVLMIAASERKTVIVKDLLDKGANANLKDNNGNTAMIETIEAIANLPDDVSEEGLEHVEQETITIVRILLEKGADVNVTNNHGQTALTMAEAWAKSFGRSELATVIREASVN